MYPCIMQMFFLVKFIVMNKFINSVNSDNIVTIFVV